MNGFYGLQLLLRACVCVEKQIHSQKWQALEKGGIRDVNENLFSERVISYKRLRGGIHFIDAIPRNPTGKILRRNLKEIAEKTKPASKL